MSLLSCVIFPTQNQTRISVLQADFLMRWAIREALSYCCGFHCYVKGADTDFASQIIVIVEVDKAPKKESCLMQNYMKKKESDIQFCGCFTLEIKGYRNKKWYRW